MLILAAKMWKHSVVEGQEQVFFGNSVTTWGRCVPMTVKVWSFGSMLTLFSSTLIHIDYSKIIVA